MLAQVKQLATQFGTTILMVTHHPEDAVAIADQVLLIDEGKVKYHLNIDQLSANNESLKDYIS